MCSSLIGWWFLISQSQRSKRCDGCKPSHQTPTTLPWSSECWIFSILFEVQRFEFWTDFRYNGMKGNLWVSACLVRDLKPVRRLVCPSHMQIVYSSIGDAKNIFCFILQSMDAMQELVCFCCLFKFYRVRLVKINIIRSVHVYLTFSQTILLELMKMLEL